MVSGSGRMCGAGACEAAAGGAGGAAESVQHRSSCTPAQGNGRAGAAAPRPCEGRRTRELLRTQGAHSQYVLGVCWLGGVYEASQQAVARAAPGWRVKASLLFWLLTSVPVFVCVCVQFALIQQTQMLDSWEQVGILLRIA